MDKDKFETQSGGIRLKEGHEESDLSIRGIVLFGLFLAVGGIFSFLLMVGMIHWLEYQENKAQAPLTRMEQELQDKRNLPREGLGKQLPATEEPSKPPPDWYGRGEIENHLSRTFKTNQTPLLQYNDEHDMGFFVKAEKDWLESAGKGANGSIHIPIESAMDKLAKDGLPQVSGPWQPANVGAPSAAYPTGASDTGQPAQRSATGGARK